MIILLSPAKTFNKHLIPSMIEPIFKKEASLLFRSLKKVPLLTLKTSMKLSDALLREVNGYLNEFGKTSYQAITSYDGQAYKALDVRSLDDETIQYASHHLYILSGMYGLLRAMDGIYRYRLEMQDKTIDNLYNFWKPKLYHYLKRNHAGDLIINLSSKEYEMVLDPRISYVNIQFYERTNQELKQLSMMVKTMRGKFARHLLIHRIEDIKTIKSVLIDNFKYDHSLSNDKNLVFVKEVSQ